MNERIRELYLQASVDDSVDSEETMVEKFAELIVRECVSTLDEADGSVHHRECLFDHFGVRE